jgi:hypothetical protein
LSFLQQFLTSCSSTSKVTFKSEKPAEFKLISVPEGKALVYILRSQFLGVAINFKVYCDGNHVGLTKGINYIYAIVEPGKHTFLSQAENKEELQMLLESNQSYFIEQISQMGAIKARNKLVVLDEAEGTEKLEKCKLSKGFQPQ